MEEINANAKLIKLMEILSSDSEKAQEFSNKKSQKELYDYCISLVPGYSETEFAEFMANLSQAFKLKNNKNGNYELSEKDLENVSGGGFDFSILSDLISSFNAGKDQGGKIASAISGLFPPN